jgi:hypothetical protein
LVISGVFAQLAGRVVGSGAGIAWMLSSKRKWAAAPEIRKRTSLLTSSEELVSSAIQQEVVSHPG